MSVTVWAAEVELIAVEAKARLDGVRLTVGSAMPVPLRAMVCGVLAALSAKLSVAESAPAAAGLKVTETVQEALATSVAPQVVVCEKEEAFVPVMEMPERFNAPVPVLVRVTACAAEEAPTIGRGEGQAGGREADRRARRRRGRGPAIDDIGDVERAEAGGFVVAGGGGVAGQDSQLVAGGLRRAIDRSGKAGRGDGAGVDVVEVAGAGVGCLFRAAIGVALLGGQRIKLGVGIALRGAGFLIDEGHDAGHHRAGDRGSADGHIEGVGGIAARDGAGDSPAAACRRSDKRRP